MMPIMTILADKVVAVKRGNRRSRNAASAFWAFQVLEIEGAGSLSASHTMLFSVGNTL